MKKLSKLIVRVGLLSPLPAMPLAAQIDNGVDFTTKFSFYVGTAKMPAGSYTITQSDIDASILRIRSNNGLHTAFVDILPTQSAQPHPHSNVTLHKYGDAGYLDRIWVEGQEYGMKVDPTKADIDAGASAK